MTFWQVVLAVIVAVLLLWGALLVARLIAWCWLSIVPGGDRRQGRSARDVERGWPPNRPE